MIQPIIWQTPRGDCTFFEFEWITKDLFSKFEIEYHYDHGSYKTFIDKAVIIYSNPGEKISSEFLNYLKTYKSLGYEFFLLHLSEENLMHDCSYYSLAKHVFRNYYNPTISYPSNVTIIPLGYKSGYRNNGEPINPVEKRTIPVCFIGQIKSDRAHLVSVLETIPNSFIHKTMRWNCPTALSQSQVADLYSKMLFVPCPQGWIHVDSFRICEALEWGAIPIIKNYGYSKQLGWIGNDHPLPVVESWEEIPNLIQNVNYDILHKRCLEWYKQLKLNVASSIYQIITQK